MVRSVFEEVHADAEKMTAFLNEKLSEMSFRIELLPTVITRRPVSKDMKKVMDDDDCIGVDHMDAYLLSGQDVDQGSSGAEKAAASSAHTG
jgi:hypothetical protein